jgi:Uma2 family endonuclease
MNEPARQFATYADLEALPPNVVGEIVQGVLHASPRPRVVHANASSALGAELFVAFRRGRGGPGGWRILDEPELHFGQDVVVPDVAGWKVETLGGELPPAAAIRIAPDWLCEVLSLDVYARERVPWVWFVDPEAKLLEVFEWVGGTYQRRAAHTASAVVRVPPFEAIELELGVLWEL